MHKELNTIRVIKEYMIQKKEINASTKNIDDIYNLFEFISNKGRDKFHSLYILNYLYNFIVSEEVAKRKTSARVFEDLLAILLNGVVTDSKSRKNIKSDVPDYFGFTKLIEKNSYKIEDLLTIINRWEGNSIRIDREKLIKTTDKKIILDFSILDKTIIKNINDFDHLLHVNYIRYFHEEDRAKIKDETIQNLEELFEKFDKSFKELS